MITFERAIGILNGVTYTILTKIESEGIKKPFVILMAKVAKAVSISIEDLLKK